MEGKEGGEGEERKTKNKKKEKAKKSQEKSSKTGRTKKNAPLKKKGVWMGVFELLGRKFIYFPQKATTVYSASSASVETSEQSDGGGRQMKRVGEQLRGPRGSFSTELPFKGSFAFYFFYFIFVYHHLKNGRES